MLKQGVIDRNGVALPGGRCVLAPGGTVAELWRYPVKSMRGERLTIARMSERGIAGDRTYALRDPHTGKVASAKHPRLWGRLLDCEARINLPSGAVRITLPDGQQVTAGEDNAVAALGALLGRAVHLTPIAPEAPKIERYWPDVDGLALRDTVTSGAIGQGAPEGTFFDYAPLHILTTASLAALAAVYPPGQIDFRRFRPNLVIATPPQVEGFAENAWVGGTLLLGEVRLRVTNPVPRCVVPTLAQDDLGADNLEADIGILRAIAAANRPAVPALGGARVPCLGVYATVERGGAVRVGDAVQVALTSDSAATV